MSEFSMDQLLKFLYKETSPDLSAAISKALETDIELREKLDTLAMAKERLDALEQLSPGQKTIDSILSYSRSTSDNK